MGKVAKGTAWSLVEKFSVQGIQFVLSLIIARLLLPSDYGLIAMLTVFISISQVFVDAGFTRTLIQKQDRTDKDFSTVFYFNIAISCLIYALLFLSSHAIAAFYHEPQLELILKFTALNIVITSFSAIQNTILLINMDFKRSAKITVTSVIISGSVALWLAYHGFGVWTLVFQSLIGSAITAILLWLSSKWRPQFAFSCSSFREMFGFGSKLLVSSLITAIYNNLYSLVIGRMLNSKSLGLYNRASTMAYIIPTNLNRTFSSVTFTAECEIQDHNELLQQKHIQYIRMVSYVVFPVQIGIAVLADPIVRLMLTDKWAECIPILQILCLAKLFDPVMFMNWQLVTVKRRGDYSLYGEILKKVAGFTILALTIFQGLYVLCWGLAVYQLFDLLIMTWFTRKLFPRITFFNEMRSLAPLLLLSAAMAAAIILVNSLYDASSHLVKVIVGVIVGITSYCSLSYVCGNKEFKTLMGMAQNGLKRN